MTERDDDVRVTDDLYLHRRKFDAMARAEGYVKVDTLRAFLLDARNRLDSFLAALDQDHT